MPLPLFLIGAAAAAGISGIVKGGEAISNNSKAKNLVQEAEDIYNTAKEQLEEQRIKTSDDLAKLGEIKLNSWANEIGRFVKLFKAFKNVDIEKSVDIDDKLRMKIEKTGNLSNMETASLKATEVVKAGVASLGAGALAGIASYGGAMMFASASTGTAIATLSGAAATNATLAWFGGGAIASGGLGIAGGTAVLGGIVAGPVLAVAGFIMNAKSKENLASAEKTYAEAENAVAKMETMSEFMKKVSVISNNYKSFISEYSEAYSHILDELDMIRQGAYESQKSIFSNKIKDLFGIKFKIDYTKLSPQEQKGLHMSWLMAQVLYNILSSPILTQEGQIDKEAQKNLDDAKNSMNKMLGSGK